TSTGRQNGASGLIVHRITPVAMALRQRPGRAITDLLPPSIETALAGSWLHSIPNRDLDAARVVVAEMLAPAGEDAAEGELGRLKLVTKEYRRSDDDLELMLSIYVHESAAYPLHIIIT